MLTKRVKFFAILFTLLFITGCWQKGSGDYKVYLDPNFESDKQALVKQGVTKWETMVDGTVTFHYVTDWHQDNDLITISPSDIQALTNLYGDKNNEIDDVVGETRYEGTSSLILLSIDETPEMFLQCTEHEMGHALGLGHTDPGEVMYHSQNGAAKEVVCGDVVQFCSIWDCDPWKLSGCQLP